MGRSHKSRLWQRLQELFQGVLAQEVDDGRGVGRHVFGIGGSGGLGVDGAEGVDCGIIDDAAVVAATPPRGWPELAMRLPFTMSLRAEGCES